HGGSREAWCYGGLGLSVSLLLTARLAGNAAWEAKAIELARLEAGRAESLAGVKDACLCHGASGNGHLYNRLFHATGEQVFRNASLEWYRRTLAGYQPDAGIGGY